MIKLHKGGVYLVDGQLVPAARAQGDPRLQDATPQQAKKATIAYSILQAHNHSGDPASLQIRFDALASHDITYVGIIQTARASGMEKFPHALCADQLPQLPVRRGRHHQRGRPRVRPVRRQKVRRHLCPGPPWRSSTSTCGR